MAYTLRYGGKKGKKLSFRVANDLLAIRFDEAQSFQRLVRKTHSRAEVSSLQEVARFDDANVVVMRVPVKRGAAKKRDVVRKILKPAPGVRFAGRVLQDPKSRRPVLYTENFFVKFQSDLIKSKCKSLLKKFNLTIKREYVHAPNTFFVAAKEGAGVEKVFSIGEKLLSHKSVELCHPELVRERSFKSAFHKQWHLKKTNIDGRSVNAHAHVEDAWSMSTGKGVTVCVIDDGTDVDHQDFSGAGKVVHGRDVTEQNNNPKPKRPFYSCDFPGDAHGTPCAGVACANGKHKSSGVAPDASLMPIRLYSGLGSMAEHDAFIWASEHGADVISCSWGPPDGYWADPDDPRHDQITPLPDSTRTAMEYAVTHGRNGNGCVIIWAAGNGNESVDNDGYASSEFVNAVAACSDRSKRSVYSDYGNAIWCSFPSSNFAVMGEPDPLTPGIWTSDRRDDPNEGYNPNCSGGDAEGKYTEDFGGTSSACPGVAGVAALMLAENPDLTWIEVSNILADTSDQIDKSNGRYDAITGHSPFYGFGRVNAVKAVERARLML